MEKKKKSTGDKLNEKVEKINRSIDHKINKVSSKLKKGGINISKKEKQKNKEQIEIKNPSDKFKDIDSKIDAKKSKETKKKKSKKKNIILIILTTLAITLLSIFLIFVLYIVITAPKFDENALYNKEATIIYDAKGNELAKIGSEKRELVSYDELPQVLIDAIVATEDSRFFQHNGFDLARFLKASVGQLSGNSSAGGASTLTMQVVKNTFTSREASGIKGIIRKFTDIYMSIFKVEKNYTK